MGKENQWIQISKSQRILIAEMLSKGVMAVAIASAIGVDATSVSREVSRHLVKTKDREVGVTETCPIHNRWPHCCNACKKRWGICHESNYVYKPEYANEEALKDRVITRVGLNMSQEEFQYLDKAIREGLASKRSLYDIKKGDSSIKVSLGTIYRLIREGKLSSKRYDLPYAVTYKKRKVQNKKYEYSSNCEIDRTHHTFLDYLSCLRKSPNVFASQLDFLGSIKTDSSMIITLTIPRLHFIIIRKMKSPTSQDVVSFFDRLEENMTSEGYREVFPIVLGDRDPRFADYKGIEFSKLDGAIRSSMFYCDAFRSNQKANVENMNKQLRKYFPKGLSIDSLTNEQVMAINEAINNSRVASLDGSSPKEAFINVYGETLLLDIEKTK